jgi:hydroxymethylpyrimidine/phosphomethylpyrimidine kinase
LKKILTIAGSDCSGGAGIQADIKTFSAHKMYGMSVITALTAQNTIAVFGVEETTPDFVSLQLDAVFTDIFPDAVKVGMVSNVEIIRNIAKKLRFYKAKNIVVDPVMVSTSGGKLISDNAIEALKGELFQIATIITPNLRESEALCGFAFTSEDDMLIAAQKLCKAYNCAVLIKGGHSLDNADDLLYYNDTVTWLRGERVSNPNTHGTGCTLSSAIACRLADGYSIPESVKLAKEYICGALEAMLDLGSGSGPLNHMYKELYCRNE